MAHCRSRAGTVTGERRQPEQSCKVYAALTAILAGIDRALPAPEACADDLYQRHANVQPLPPRLPRDLLEACAALRADASLRDAVSAAF